MWTAEALPPVEVVARGFVPVRAMLAAFVAAAALAVLFGAGLRGWEPAGQLVTWVAVVVLLSLAALLLVSGVREVAGGLMRWRIGPWFLLWTGLTSGLASLTWLAPQTGLATQISMSSVVSALVVVAVAILVWTLGYCAGPPRAVRTVAGRAVGFLLRGTGTEIRGGAAPWVAYGIGAAAQLVAAVVSGRFGYVGDPRELTTSAAPYANILHILSTFTLFAVVAAAYRAFSPRAPGSRVTLVVLVTLETVLGALAGGKQYYILVVLAVLIPYTVLRGRTGVALMVAAAAAFLWIVVPFNIAYRDLVRTSTDALPVSTAFAAAPQVLSAVVDDQSPAAAMAESADQTAHRLRQIDGLAVVVQRTPEAVPYRSPAELAYAPLLGLVPRAVWPDKPVITTGYDFNQDYYGLPSDVYTASEVTLLGDLYRHGGWPVVVMGMLLLGAACRLFDVLFRAERDPRAVLFLLVFLPVIGRMGAYNFLIMVPTGLVTAVLGARLLCRDPQPEPAP